MKYDLEFEEQRFSKDTLWKIGIIVVEIVAVILLAFFITHFGMERMTVSDDTMNPTLKNGDDILINKMSYHIHGVHRNDVVVIKQTGSEHEYYSLVRVIGLPGETIQIKDNAVYIDGEKLKEKYAFEKIENAGLASDPITLDKKEYFVLSDNRNECEDSRNANVGNIMKSSIIGKAWFRLNSLAIVKQIDGFQSGMLTKTSSKK